MKQASITTPEGIRENQFMIPAEWYWDPQILQRELELIFSRTWQWVGRIDQVAGPGAYFTCEVAGERILVVRGADGLLRAFSNVCRHRAGPVAEGSGVARRFQCPYHGWTYGLDGVVLGTPHFKIGEGLSPGQCRLPEFKVATWGPLVFVNLDDEAVPLSETLGDLPERFSRYGLDDLFFQAETVTEMACNWKVHEENSLECYHCPTLHPSFYAAHKIDHVELEQSDLFSVMYIPYRSSAMAGGTDEETISIDKSPQPLVKVSVQPREALDGKEKFGLYVLFGFPNLQIGFNPDHFMARKLVPAGPERLVVVSNYFAWAPDSLADILALRTQTTKEDAAMCEAVQKGLRSRFYTNPERYSPKEPLVYQFHTLLRQFLGEQPGGNGETALALRRG